jgi:hypothetical protein
MIFILWKRRGRFRSETGSPPYFPSKSVTPTPQAVFSPRSFPYLFFSMMTVFFAALLVSCGGESDGPGIVVPPGSTSPTQIQEATAPVSAAGVVDFVGSGDFSGLVIKAEGMKEAAGGRLRIVLDPNPPDPFQGNFYSAGNLFTLTLLDRNGNTVSNGAGLVTASFPYRTTVVAQARQEPADLRLLRNGEILSATVSEDRAVLTAAFAGFSSFIVVFELIPPTALPHPLPLIEPAWDGYVDAPKIMDPTGNPIADSARGINIVQVGERVMLQARRQDISGHDYTTFDWQITARPAGDSSLLSGSGSRVELIPQQVGRYEITLTASNAFVSETAAITVTAGSYSYIEENGAIRNFCQFCHSGTDLERFGHIQDIYGRPLLRDMVGPWSRTNHAKAFANLSPLERNNTVCLNCHTTGFLFADRTGNVIDDYPEAFGFDDFITDWNEPEGGGGGAPSFPRGFCESCHGPGGAGTPPPSSGFQHDYRATLAQGPCMACHNIDPDQQIEGRDYFYGWEGDLHVDAHRVREGRVRVADTDPCYNCHVGQYFIGRMHNKNLVPADIDEPEGITCVVCHDPHGESGHPFQLRVAGEVSVRLKTNGGAEDFQTLTFDAGMSGVCYSCHNAFFMLPAVGEDLHGNQAEMMEGIGGFTYGRELGGLTHGLRTVPDKCVRCHMIAEHEGEPVTTHQRRLFEGEDIFTGTDYTIIGCSTADCHQGPLALPATGNRFDYDGKTTEILASLEALQLRINQILGRAPDSAISHNYGSVTSLTEEQLTAINRAAYNYFFVMRDGSFGVHNYPYAAALLELSMADLARF